MVFSSHVFIFYFLPLALLGYYALAFAPQRWRNLWLILTGYFFYGWAEPRFVVLMFATTFIDWLMSLVIAHDSWRIWRFFGKPTPVLPRHSKRSQSQHAAITTSVVLNLVVLGFFKYFNFGVESFNAAVVALGFPHAQWDTFFRVVLPLGISFYTFQALSYTIDVYRGEAEAMANFIDFSCFVSMFPHLVAGPILKFSFLAEQLKHRRLTSDKFARGVAFFMLGLAKKILLANPCGKIADTCFRCRIDRRDSTPGSARSPTRSKSTSTSAATPTWRSGSDSCSVSSSRKISIHRIARNRSPISGGAGTSHFPPGCASIFTFRWAEIGAA